MDVGGLDEFGPLVQPCTLELQPDDAIETLVLNQE